ncbi:MAG TPA: amidase, partial [Solirubrobacterales bacterium]|nr:amidase [Solirubrobacterales bacterium]
RPLGRPPAAPLLGEEEDRLAFTPLTTQAAMLAAGEISSRRLVELSLARIEAAQPVLNAFRVVRAEAALHEAEEADRRIGLGESAPLLGVPIAIKDDVDLAGHTTPFGCSGVETPAERDAEAVRRLREAGAIVVGKTNAPEVGQWHFTEGPTYGATRNPWNTDHTPGGSSGGAAAAVAAGLVAGAMGSDGAGSIRIPAAWNGLVGLKPQRGRVSTWPEPEAFNGLSCYGPITRTAADAALMLDALSGNVAADRHQVPVPETPFAEQAGRDPGRLRIAISFATPFGVVEKLDPECRTRVEALGERLAGLGHEVEPADPSYGLVGPALVPRGMAGVDQWLRERITDRSRLERRTVVHARFGRMLSGLPLRMARAAEPSLRARIGRIFDRFDLVLTPTTARPAPAVGALEGRGYWATTNVAGAICPYAWPWNVVGWPGISLPAGTTAAGLPVGAQLLGPERSEGLLLSLATQLEATA